GGGVRQVALVRAGGYSVGMRGRLRIASALHGDPATLIDDDPGNGGDPGGSLWVRNLVQHLATEGRRGLGSAHLTSEMGRTAEHLIVIGRRRLIADSSVEEFTLQASSGKVHV
ncbi:hypothetical protein UK12_34235, partial [Saccharothrix sp. ST-888]